MLKLADLSPRDRRIAVLVGRGFSLPAIVEALGATSSYQGTTARTVRSRIDLLRSKLPGSLPARQRITQWLTRQE